MGGVIPPCEAAQSAGHDHLCRASMKTKQRVQRIGSRYVLFFQQYVNFIMFIDIKAKHMDVSENSVPLNPMVNDHYPY